MKSTVPDQLPIPQALPKAGTLDRPRVCVRFGVTLLVLLLAFAKPLLDLLQFARESDLFSYILLVPFVSAYVGYLRYKPDPLNERGSGSFGWAALLLTLGTLALAGFWFAPARSTDRLSLVILAFVCLVCATGFLTLGANRMPRFAFPFAFLVFLVPLPAAFVNVIEIFFQHGSADVAAAMINLSGLPVVRDGLFFRLPGLLIEVAQECSGIRSTLVLFITSLLAGHLFLRSHWRRAALSLFVIPLAMLRNGFRIFTLAYLTVEVDPKVVDSALHHRGGPIFFALSLIPFFLLLVLLRKSERTTRPQQ